MRNILKLNKTIYSEECIRYAGLKYESIAEIDISENGGYFICEFKKCLYDISETMREFENFVIEYTSVKVHRNDNC